MKMFLIFFRSYQKTPDDFETTIRIPDCELLSNCIFIEFCDNGKTTFFKTILVVNCFQIVSL